MISVVSGLALQAPIIATRLLPAEPPGMVVHIFGAMAVFIGVMLAFSARDLRNRGVLVAWEGVLRLFGCAFMVGYGVYADAGGLAVYSGLFDGAIGVAYLAGLPRHLKLSLFDLLMDRKNAASQT